ncbi:MAG: Holliday junction resolvase RuvX [Tenericutes bacterium]|nr:MAG: Holliday junction resolvase RuvX [Mycoplasmatota bacterium]
MRVMALDIGQKTLGICISDSTQTIAIPVENFIFENRKFDLPVDRVVELLKQYPDTELILLGMPTRLNQVESFATEMAKEFLQKLEEKTSVKLKLIDERFSTQRGKEMLSGKYSPEELKDYKDLAAAYVMLYDHLQAL